MDSSFILLILLKIALLVAAVKIARSKGRSEISWFFICLASSIFGFLILLILPPLFFHCPKCGAEYKVGKAVCDKCQSELPDRFMTERLAASKDDAGYDHKCSICGVPYRLADYNTDLEHIYCSNCQSELKSETEVM